MKFQHMKEEFHGARQTGPGAVSCKAADSIEGSLALDVTERGNHHG
jgi:hypothetical protein